MTSYKTKADIQQEMQELIHKIERLDEEINPRLREAQLDAYILSYKHLEDRLNNWNYKENE